MYSYYYSPCTVIVYVKIEPTLSRSDNTHSVPLNLESKELAKRVVARLLLDFSCRNADPEGQIDSFSFSIPSLSTPCVAILINGSFCADVGGTVENFCTKALNIRGGK